MISHLEIRTKFKRPSNSKQETSNNKIKARKKDPIMTNHFLRAAER